MANPKRPTDINQRAKSIVSIATGETEDVDPDRDKNPAAVSLGRLGGLKGGKARAKKLTDERKSEIAKNAVTQRWANRP
jgi:hypothetical protein